jgi:hypothetical protein
MLDPASQPQSIAQTYFIISLRMGMSSPDGFWLVIPILCDLGEGDNMHVLNPAHQTTLYIKEPGK